MATPNSTPQTAVPTGPTSKARRVGRVAPPPGVSWEDALASPRLKAQLLLDVQVLAARALAVATGRVSLLVKGLAEDLEKASNFPGRWHTHWNGEYGYVTCTLGYDPTDFLLGDIPVCWQTVELRALSQEQLQPLEDGMEISRGEPGELFGLDHGSIHRRPRLSLRPRLVVHAAVERDRLGGPAAKLSDIFQPSVTQYRRHASRPDSKDR